MTTGKGWTAWSFGQHPNGFRHGFPDNLVGNSNETIIDLEGQPCHALLDTGSSVSLISETFFRTYKIPLQPLHGLLDIEGAAGQKLSYLGYVCMDLTLSWEKGSIKQPCLFLVTPDTKYSERVPVLLGTNILWALMEQCQQHCGVRFLQTSKLGTPWQLAFRCITLQDKHIERSKGVLGVLKSAETRAITIPSNSSAIIYCSVGSRVGYHQCLAMTQAVPNSTLPGLDITPTVCNYASGEDSLIPLQVHNLTTTTLNVQPRSVLSELHLCSLQDTTGASADKKISSNSEEESFFSKFDLSQTTLTSKEKKKVNDFLLKWKDVFSQHEDDIGFTNAVKHQIKLSDSTPFKQRYRKIPPSMYEEVRQHLQHLLRAGIIRKSQSPFSSNVVLVRRKNGSLRLCVDFRFLNLRTIKDSYALPRIDDLLDGLSGSKYFSVLDLKSAYMQVEIEEDHKEYTAFTVGPLGFYQFERMPFGLCNSPATYQRLMDEVLGDLNHRICQVYLDDIVITGLTFEDHLERLGLVFGKLKDSGMKVAPKKCQLFKEEVQYVGHIVTADGVRADPAKTDKIQSWPTPSNVSQLQSFLGFTGFYRRYIRDYSKIAHPLNMLLGGTSTTGGKRKKTGNKDTTKWIWGPEQEQAFEKLKSCLTSPPILGFPDFKKPFALYVDASMAGLGAVLYQRQNDMDRVIAYASRSLTKGEKNYSAHKLEYLGLKWAVTQKFSDYLYGNQCVVYTDHNPLTYLLTSAKLDATGHRWLSALSAYDFTIKYRPGKAHTDVDTLSRLPSLSSDTVQEHEEISLQSVKAICQAAVEPVYLETICMNSEVCDMGLHGSSLTYRDWRQFQRADPVIGQLMQLVAAGESKPKSNISPELMPWLKEIGKYRLKRGVLYRQTNLEEGSDILQLVLPKQYQEEALRGVHDDVGHLGREKSLRLLQERFFWPKMGLELAQRISKCPRCLRRKASTQIRAPMESITTTQPLELICMDFLTLETSKGGFKYILILTDHFTKYALAVPTKDMTARTTAEAFLNSFVVHYGFPQTIHTDQGANFEGRLIRELCQMARIEKSRTTPFHPQGNGVCERFNRTLLNMLGTLEPDQKSDWKTYISPLVYAYNCTRHSTTGFAPYTLMFGRRPRLPVDVVFGLINQEERCSYNKYVQSLKEKLQQSFELASNLANKAQQKQKKYYDLKARAAVLEKGDRVLVKAVYFEGKHKLADKWESEPYVIVNRPNDEIPVYDLRKESGQGSLRRLHRNMLLPIGSLPLTDETVHDKPVQSTRTGGEVIEKKRSNEGSNDEEEGDDDLVVTVAQPPQSIPTNQQFECDQEISDDSEQEISVPDDSVQELPEDDSDLQKGEEMMAENVVPVEAEVQTPEEDTAVNDDPPLDLEEYTINEQFGEEKFLSDDAENVVPVGADVQTPEKDTAVNDDPPLRRSTRERNQPKWMKAGEYVMCQVSRPVPAPRRSRLKPTSWDVRDRINFLKILSAEGAFSELPESVSKAIWRTVVDVV